MTGGQLNANIDQYLQAAAMNTPPPQIISDPLVTGGTPGRGCYKINVVYAKGIGGPFK